jgi:two-component system OmpR family sensor kinase
VIVRASSATEEQDRLVPIVHDEASRLSRLASRLLLLARLDAHQPHARHDVDLAAVLDQQLAQLREARPDLDVAAALPPGLVAYVDTEAVGEAIANLLHNAQRHAHHRVDVSLTVSA